MATLVLMNMTLAPVILGYVSSYTRDNPFATLDQASHFDGLKRTRAVKDMLITVGDVSDGCETGHIGFAATAAVPRLQKDRLYD